MTTPTTILVADDDPLLRQLLDTVLSSAGYHTWLAADGLALLALAQVAPPDIVVADVSMPVLDGLAAIRQLRADPRTASVPVLAISARADVADAALAAGAQLFLLKPFPLDDLLTAIADLLAP